MGQNQAIRSDALRGTILEPFYLRSSEIGMATADINRHLIKMSFFVSTNDPDLN
jgi:hypothetical protein